MLTSTDPEVKRTEGFDCRVDMAAPAGLLVLGSIHTEMAALLQDAHAPLYNRTTECPGECAFEVSARSWAAS